MYAVVEIAGKQFKVNKGQELIVNRLDAKEGKKVSFDKVLLVEDKENVTLGKPSVEGAAVEAKVVEHLRGEKVIVFKKKRRKGYKRKNGYRHSLTRIKVTKLAV